MAALTTQTIPLTGVAPTYAAAAGGGDTCDPGSRTFLHVKNGGGGSINVTLTTPGSKGGVAISDPVIAVANGTEKMIGPLDPALFGDPTTGKVGVAYSGVTTVTVAVLNLAEPQP